MGCGSIGGDEEVGAEVGDAGGQGGDAGHGGGEVDAVMLQCPPLAGRCP